ncbi:hypothetical protein [Calothrix sp. 336/3]|uniref:hypothetical protein n=1 Tax=Calothrix sp. 336/3 TaxID=1337936 RepID=UPI0004E32264|nr:hypothetical protein [Calothrix sp. 336/3]AKG24165.1 hypothetical protein IJ00_25155 [Calothrix sp. 336/3]
MENHQNVQHQESQLDSQASSSKLLSLRSLILYLCLRSPWLLLVALLCGFIGSATFAVWSLGYVGRVDQPEPEVIPVEIVPSNQENPPSGNPLPLWMLAAIAISCASGCLIIFKLINNLSRPNYNFPKRRPSNSSLEPRTPKQLPVFAPTPVVKTSAKTPVKIPAKAPVKTSIPLPSLKKANVSLTSLNTPLPKKIKISQPQESLADVLDLRKQNSLPGILHK